MKKDSKKIIMNVICAFALFTLFTMFCSLLCNVTASINPILDNGWNSSSVDKVLKFIKSSYITCVIALIPVLGLFISKLFVRNKIINILENIFVVILIGVCVGFLIARSNISIADRYDYEEYTLILAQKIDLTSLLAVSCLYEVYLVYDLINVLKKDKEVTKKEIED